MNDKLKLIWKMMKQKKTYLFIVVLLLAVVSGSFITVSSAKDKSTVQVTSLKTQVLNRTKEIETLHDTIKEQETELSRLVLENQNIREDLEHYYHKDYLQEELSTTIEELQSETKTLTEKNQALTTRNSKLSKKVKTLNTKVSSLNKQVKKLKSKSSATSVKKTSSTTSKNSKKAAEQVHITETGSKYHKAWCSYLRDSDFVISKEEAQDLGFTACSRCYG